MPSEEFQNLLHQVGKLNLAERAQLQEAIRTAEVPPPASGKMTEEEFSDYLASIGMITRRKRRGPIPPFPNPVKLPGRPLSEDIIEGRGPR